MRSILSADQFSKKEVTKLLSLTHKLERKMKEERQIDALQGYILVTLFFEPSTRTRLSFETAMHRLGGRVITSVGVQFSSLSKGETLFDTLKMIEGYADICAIRHPKEGASQLAAQNLSIPIINAGDGSGEHPTQALLDLYTIDKHKHLTISQTKEKRKKLKIAFVGDIKYGRTIHSLYKLLMHFEIEMIFISPQELKLAEKDRENLKKNRMAFKETEDIESIYDVDIIYVTRIQEERFINHEEYKKFSNIYTINKNIMKNAKQTQSLCIRFPDCRNSVPI